ncbi:MAG: LysM peptidoglycan-binding domain-containing protein [Deltaproteobacteria bacterium]|nr:LysM peptidoglycan-binding domain-containing protein [Deltaproteobacteria bacterium]
MSNKTILFLICALLQLSAQGRKLFRHQLDPNRAEEILGALAAKPRLLPEQWKKVLGHHALETYTVVPGDTLWGISRKLFKNAWYWNKVWHVNQYLANPHELEIGQILAFYREGEVDSGPTVHIPVIKLTPSQKGALNDLDKDSFINVDIKDRFRSSIFVLDPDVPVYGEISGSYSPKEGLTQTDSVFVNLKNLENPMAGDAFSVVHVERELRDSTQTGSPILGTIVKLVGELKLISFEERLAKAELTSVFGVVRRNDLLVPIQKPIQWLTTLNPPDELQGIIVEGEQPEYLCFSEGNLVLVNKGRAAGMKEGYLFRVWKDKDPLLSSEKAVEPGFKGELQIIHVSQLASVAYILHNSDPLRVGDGVVPYQIFKNPPRYLGRTPETFELN